MPLPTKLLCAAVTEHAVGETGAVGLPGVPTIMYESRFHAIVAGEVILHAVLTVQSVDRLYEPGRFYVFSLTPTGTVE